MKMPKVSIGMPVYNGETVLHASLNSLLAQTESDFELLISDNASTDKTEAICRDYAERDSRVHYFRQPNNLGAEPNFAYVLDKANSEYFMWAAADNFHSPNFVELNLDFLKCNPEFVCSTSPVRFAGRKFDELQMGDRSLNDDRFDLRLRKFFGPWHANAAIYSLMRTATLKKCEWVGAKFLGADWAIVLYLASRGKLNRLSEGCLTLGIKGASNSTGYFQHYRECILDYPAPFWRMTFAVMQISAGAPLASRLVIFKECLVMNLWALKLQIVGTLYRVYKLMFR